ncbi:MAG: phosphotransferase [Caldilineaceae bacterium]
MEQRIRDRFNPQILAETAARYGVDAAQLQELDGFESFIFEFTRDDQPLILRLGHSLRRSPNLIRGEVDWINYLARGGAGVARAVDSTQGELVELIDDGLGAYFLATVFVKAAGGRPAWEAQTPAFLERYGQAIGRMHRLTKAYTPTDATCERPHWDSPELAGFYDYLPAGEAYTRDALSALYARLAALPQDETYGLVHQDAHPGNFFVDDAGALTFFDFDDCCYSWFVNDIAIVLFYNINNRADAAAYTAYFLTHFLRGYARKNRFDPAWFAPHPGLSQIALTRPLRRDPPRFRRQQHRSPLRRATWRRKARIESNVPYVDFDFAQLQWPES